MGGATKTGLGLGGLFGLLMLSRQMFFATLTAAEKGALFLAVELTH